MVEGFIDLQIQNSRCLSLGEKGNFEGIDVEQLHYMRLARLRRIESEMQSGK